MIDSTLLRPALEFVLFSNLSDAERDDIFDYGRIHRVSKGHQLFWQGDDADTLYVVVAGRFKLSQVTSDGQQVIVNYFGPGDGLGIIVALSDIPYPLTAEAVVDSEVIAWDRTQMRELMLRHPQLALNGLKMVGTRFANLQVRFQEMATQHVEQRVARAVLRLVRQFGRRVDEGVRIDIPLSREELAQMTGTNLYNVSRILSKWEQAGIIESGRRRVTLTDAHPLVAVAEDLPPPPAQK